MKRALAAIVVCGCGISPSGTPIMMGDDVAEPTMDPENPQPDPTDPGSGTGTVTEVGGHITASTTWREAIHVTAPVVVDPGVTLTIAAGATVDFPEGAGITVSGTLDIQGTKDQRVTLRGATGNFWDSVIVPRDGVMTAHYLVQTGAGVHISYTGRATIVDSHFSHAKGDLLIMASGALDMSYSEIGLPVGRDIMHCDLHIGGAPSSVKITHSNLSAASYAMMFYGGNYLDLTYNNWFGNANDIITEPGPPVSGDFSYSYFARGTPTNPGVMATHMATAMLTDTGPR